MARGLQLSGDSRLLEDMNGSAVMLSDSVQDAMLAPLGAAREDAAGAYVEKLGPDAAPVKAFMETGLSDGRAAKVLAGLAAGEEVRALDEATLTIREGELVAITEPSGSGKSTLMNIMGCLIGLALSAGLLFGLYPAGRAAGKQPVEALRCNI